jgi:hypothetical protein
VVIHRSPEESWGGAAAALELLRQSQVSTPTHGGVTSSRGAGVMIGSREQGASTRVLLGGAVGTPPPMERMQLASVKKKRKKKMNKHKHRKRLKRDRHKNK